MDGVKPHSSHAFVPSRETEVVPPESLSVTVARFFIGVAAFTLLATLLLTLVAMAGYWLVSWYTQ